MKTKLSSYFFLFGFLLFIILYPAHTILQKELSKWNKIQEELPELGTQKFAILTESISPNSELRNQQLVSYRYSNSNGITKEASEHVDSQLGRKLRVGDAYQIYFTTAKIFHVEMEITRLKGNTLKQSQFTISSPLLLGISIFGILHVLVGILLRVLGR